MEARPRASETVSRPFWRVNSILRITPANFVPTTPNPTTGFIVLVTHKQIVKLDISVTDGIKFIMSLGSVAPDSTPPAQAVNDVNSVDSKQPGSPGQNGAGAPAALCAARRTTGDQSDVRP